MSAGPRIKFTVFESVTRLSKRYSLASDGKSVIKESFTQLYEGGYRVVTVPAGDIPAALQACGIIFDALTYEQAITLGVPRDGSTAGLITTKGKVRDGTAPAVAIPRDLEHFGWPELALLFLDGDDRDGLYELLCGHYPALAKVAALVRPSVSACVAHPVTGKALKTRRACLSRDRQTGTLARLPSCNHATGVGARPRRGGGMACTVDTGRRADQRTD